MQIHLAGTKILKGRPDLLKKIPYILETFYAVSDWQIPYFKSCKHFLLDSGAFTFKESFNKGKKLHNVDFNTYLDRYASFVKENGIDDFFELDVDVVLGYKEVRKMREKLESKVGRQCVPVWHLSRGKQDFIDMCKEYKYVSMGGLRFEIGVYRHKYLPWFIDKAHEYGCRIHGLGFTASGKFDEIRFDTVDSTTWLNSAKFANISYYHDGIIVQEHKYGYRLSEGGKEKLMEHNLNEWLKCVKHYEED